MGDQYIDVTNKYQHGVANIGNASLPKDYLLEKHPDSEKFSSESYAFKFNARNKRNYVIWLKYFLETSLTRYEFCLDLIGFSGGEEFSHNKFVFDGTGNTHTNYVNIGYYNFKGMGNEDYSNGIFETIYSNVEPIERTEAVLRTETKEYENWIWDEETGDYILDPDEPYITETYEWWDEYTFDMVWEIEPGTIWEYDITRVGETALRVNVQRIYKTQPYVGTGN